MRNAFWTRMTPHTDPRNADRPTWKLEEFNQGPAIASFADWENGPESLRARHAAVEADHPISIQYTAPKTSSKVNS